MGIEKLSAEDVDRPRREAGAPDKREGVEHLRSMRNILTPFIGDYVAAVREDIHSKSNPEFLNFVGYKGEVTANYTEFLARLKEHGISAEELRYFHYAGTEQAYEAYLQENKLADSTDAINSFVDHLEEMERIGEQSGISLGSMSMAFTDTLMFAEGNVKHFFSPNRADWWTDLDVKSAQNMILGTAYSRSHTRVFPSVIVMPIGEYGDATARKIYNTIQIMLSDTEILEKKAAELVESHREIFSKTARGGDDLRSLEDMSRASLKMLQEGIITLGQVMAQLTAEKIHGYEDSPDNLVADLVKNEIPNQMGYLAPPGYIGPFSLMGMYVSGLLENKNDELILNEDILEEMQKVKRGIADGSVPSGASGLSLPAAGRGCPISFKGQGIETSGINELSQLFLELYKAQ